MTVARLMQILMALLTIGLLVFFLSGCTSMTIPQLRGTFHATNAADVGTTLYGIDQGCQEGGLFAGAGKEAVVGIGLATAAAAELVCGNASSEESEKICWVAFTWVKMFAVGWNSSQLAQGCN